MSTQPLVGRVWPHGMMSSIRQDWATPRALFEMLDREFDFSLDACSNEGNRVSQSIAFIDPAIHDSLSMAWSPVRSGAIWCNPPYGRRIGNWIQKAYSESLVHGMTVVLLLPARTDTQWFHDYCMKGEIRFLRGRLCFDDKRRGRCPFPSMIVIFRAAR